jgi:predicted site-specific integrase-resolvase
MNKQQSKSLAAAKCGMDEKTARKYIKEGKLPSQLKKPRTYRTRKDPFDLYRSDKLTHFCSDKMIRSLNRM